MNRNRDALGVLVNIVLKLLQQCKKNWVRGRHHLYIICQKQDYVLRQHLYSYSLVAKRNKMAVQARSQAFRGK